MFLLCPEYLLKINEVLTAYCSQCDHKGRIDPETTDLPPKANLRKLKCSKCGSKEFQIILNSKKNPII